MSNCIEKEQIIKKDYGSAEERHCVAKEIQKNIVK